MEMGAGDDRHTGQLTGEHSGDFCYLSAQPADSQKKQVFRNNMVSLNKKFPFTVLPYCNIDKSIY